MKTLKITCILILLVIASSLISCGGGGGSSSSSNSGITLSKPDITCDGQPCVQ